MINTEQLTEKQLAAMFDHTFLKAYASEEDLKKLCREAKELGAAMVAINSGPVAFCKKQLEGTGIHVGAAISFPLRILALISIPLSFCLHRSKQHRQRYLPHTGADQNKDQGPVCVSY